MVYCADVVGEAEREREQRTVQGGDHDDDQWYLKFTEGPVNEKGIRLLYLRFYFYFCKLGLIGFHSAIDHRSKF